MCSFLPVFDELRGYYQFLPNDGIGVRPHAQALWRWVPLVLELHGRDVGGWSGLGQRIGECQCFQHDRAFILD